MLLLAAWVSGAGSISAFTTPRRSPPTDEEHGETVDQGQTDNSTPRGPRPEDVEPIEIVTTVVVWTMRVLLVIIGAAILFFVLRTLMRRLRRDPVMVKEEVQAGLLPDVLIAGLRDSESQLDHGTSSEAVINAWLTLERTAAAVGIGDDQSRTPTELVEAVLAEYDVDHAAIERLATLYREARFSVHPMGEEQRAAAREAIQRVRADLTRPLLALGEEVRQ